MNAPEQNPSMPQKCPQCGAELPPGALGGLCPACLLKQGATAETATLGEAFAFEPPRLEELAKLFPNLEIIELIGKGGMGAVYKARQPALDRLVALKTLPPQVASGPRFAERFNREARALARLNHPNIVGIYDFGQVGGLAYFLMEYVDGLNLRQVQRAGKLSPREALQIVPQICAALQFAHDEGIVHRDIKPENILLDKKGRVKIADFGIAKIMGREPDFNLTETKMAIGTPQYMAPEQIEKPQSVDHRADIFSLGVVFYEMLTGELPLGKFAPPSSAPRAVHVDVRLDDVVLRTLEKEPERRYQQASQVKTAVETISSTQPSAAAAPAETEAFRATLASRDYSLGVIHCITRAWRLVTSDFWRIVGINALVIVLLWAVGAFPISFGSHGAIPGASIISMLMYGPLVGGLYYSYLKRIRGEKVSVETAFSGFGSRFVQLLLGSFVGFCLIALGLVCLILPGIYFLVCWAYAIPLIIDKNIDFWPAFAISRQMVRKHWWKNFALLIVLSVLHAGGFLLFGVGIFFTSPIAAVALMYAFQDIFSAESAGAAPAPKPVGPQGTQVVQPRSGGSWLKPVAIGAAAIVLILFVIAAIEIAHHDHFRRATARRIAREAKALADQSDAPDQSDSAEQPAGPHFGDVQEKTVTQGINFKTGNGISLPQLANESLNSDERILMTLRTADRLGIDAYVTSDGRGLYLGNGTRLAQLAETNWDAVQPDQITRAVEIAAVSQPPQVLIELGTNETATYAFTTQDKAQGLLQLVSTNADPSGLNIRYKLVQDDAARAAPAADSRARLKARLDAAEAMNNIESKDKALLVIATNAAQARQFNICRDAISEIVEGTVRDEAASVSAKTLSTLGMQREALELAQGMINGEDRDRTLAELAR
jgi:predicted Ser/Thr protein kinase